MSIDITERKEAELVNQQAVSRLQATLESTADGILVVDLQGRIVDFNQQFTEVWRFPQNLVAQGQKVDLVAAFNEHQAMADMLSQLKEPETFVQRVREIYTTPQASSFDVLEFKDGRVVERYSQPQRIDDTPVGRVWSFRDVSERKHLEEQLRQSQKMEAILHATTRQRRSTTNRLGRWLSLSKPDALARTWVATVARRWTP